MKSGGPIARRTRLKSKTPLARSGPIKAKRRTRTTKHRDGRIVLSDSAWSLMKRTLWESREHVCGICGEPIFFVDDYELDHIAPRGMGGGKRDDRAFNLQLSHRWCNREKGSKR